MANRTIFHGDNLPVLQGINSECIDLIATDPPFNKGRDFHSTPDKLLEEDDGGSFQDRWSWKRDVHDGWFETLQKDHSMLAEAIEGARFAHSDGMGAFMCFQSVRLLEMRRILKKTGSLWLHCDPTASHYLKACLDAIFGANNFRNEVVWRRSDGQNNAVRKFSCNHDIIFFYTKSDEYTVNIPRVGGYEDGPPTPNYKHWDEDKECWYSAAGHLVLDKSNASKTPERSYTYTKKDGTTFKPRFGWRKSEEEIKQFDDAGDIHWTSNGIPRLKLYWEEGKKGVAMPDIWTDIKRLSGRSKERTKYPTQKPIALYKRIIETSTNKGDVVLDPFCGCTTTLMAAAHAKRKWIGVDLWDNVGDMVKERLVSEKLAIKGAPPPSGSTADLFADEVEIRTDLPERTDEGDNAGRSLRSVTRRTPPNQMSKKQARQILLLDVLKLKNSYMCDGCDTVFNDPLYLEVDHNIPKADDGIDHISNYRLLCSPCNRIKGKNLTIRQLRKKNEETGRMRDQAAKREETRQEGAV